MFLIALDDPLVIRRFANIERDRLESNLEDVPEDIELVAKSLDIKFRKNNEEYVVYFIDFINGFS